MPESRAKQWIGYRPEIRVIDCTIRDGGLMNDHKLTDAVVRGVYLACCQGGVDYMEIGYRGAPRMYKPGEHGKWRFCAEDELKKIVDSAGEDAGKTKLSVMADVDRTDVKSDFPNPRYHLRPIVGCVQHHIEPLRKEFAWGPDIPYMLSGRLNRHPRAAMEFNDGTDRGDYVKFYDLIME